MRNQKQNACCMHTFSVMQSDWYSFCRDVALNSVDMSSRDKDNILDQIYVYISIIPTDDSSIMKQSVQQKM